MASRTSIARGKEGEEQWTEDETGSLKEGKLFDALHALPCRNLGNSPLLACQDRVVQRSSLDDCL